MRRVATCLRLRQLVEERIGEGAIDMRAEQDPVQVEDSKSY